MANAQGGVVIIGVKDSNHEIVGVQENRLGETLDVILRAARQIVKPELVLEPRADSKTGRKPRTMVDIGRQTSTERK